MPGPRGRLRRVSQVREQGAKAVRGGGDEDAVRRDGGGRGAGPVDLPGAHLARIAGALGRQPELAAVYEPLLTGREYDPGLGVPTGRRGLLAGMGMAEKQGGSDVRANTTAATPSSEPGVYTLRGHKWFTSAPMCDLFLVLAQAPAGLTCFLVPRVLPDGSRARRR
ncbi:putative oxidoreductase [Streptomyces bottropensis ATCC 25435]|uniref:Putative oxidoreductase n=1 Tax=Streptomyces bottropensis ATCC 25435 TaxID=1054862 RepID=M3G0I4_9ACTN|nr:putative oxidoreductase [Streptomyces bottropensis ATCC 25435]